MMIMQKSPNSHLMKRSEIRDLALGVWDADDEDDLIEESQQHQGGVLKTLIMRVQLK
jgi:hypothetical protein